jgi:protein-S-isoprenylcysteine O-methyltransferase Ste14
MKKIATKDIILVSIQILLILTYFIPILQNVIFFNFYIRISGLVLSILGFLVIIIAILQLNKNLTPFPTPKESGTLIQNGLYKFARHPIYSGIILASIFFGIFSESLWKIMIGFAFFILFYFKSKYEESMLEKQYKDYKTYKLKTRRFFPFF